MHSILIFILFTKNNMNFSLMNIKGKLFKWFSLGQKRMKGTKKLNALTSNLLTKVVINYVMKLNYSIIHLKIKGSNKYKQKTLKMLKKSSLYIVTISDLTIQPHNGCKLKNIRNY